MVCVKVPGTYQKNPNKKVRFLTTPIEQARYLSLSDSVCRCFSVERAIQYVFSSGCFLEYPVELVKNCQNNVTTFRDFVSITTLHACVCDRIADASPAVVRSGVC